MNKTHSIRRWLAPELLLVAGVVLTGGFGAGVYHQWDYTCKVTSGEIPVESKRGWMTLAYVARTYQAPEAAIRRAPDPHASGNVDRNLRVWLNEAGIDPSLARKSWMPC